MNRQTKNLLIALINFAGSLLGIALIISLARTDVTFLQALDQPMPWFLATVGSIVSYISLETNIGFRFLR